jgi:hypothetical protein
MKNFVLLSEDHRTQDVPAITRDRSPSTAFGIAVM